MGWQELTEGFGAARTCCPGHTDYTAGPHWTILGGHTHTHTLATILTTSTDHGSNLMQAPSLSLIKFLNLIIFQPCFIVITMNAIHVQEQNHSSNCRQLIQSTFALSP